MLRLADAGRELPGAEDAAHHGEVDGMVSRIDEKQFQGFLLEQVRGAHGGAYPSDSCERAGGQTPGKRGFRTEEHVQVEGDDQSQNEGRAVDAQHVAALHVFVREAVFRHPCLTENDGGIPYHPYDEAGQGRYDDGEVVYRGEIHDTAGIGGRVVWCIILTNFFMYKARGCGG